MLHTFGDSWTEGVGGSLKEEYSTENPEERTKIRQKYCWPKYLSDKLGIPFTNYGIGGCSNKIIFEAVCNSIENESIKKNDFVVIMWSSSLRDSLPFFPTNNPWHFWGERYKSKEHLYKFIFTKSEVENQNYGRLKKDFMDFYISNLYSDEYYNIVNRNYILYLQFMFKNLGIRYLFCDAFDLMIKNTTLTDVKTFVDFNHYLGYASKTIRDYLIDTKRKDVWEDNLGWGKIYGKHPSKLGYEIIANRIYEFIIEKNILNYEINIYKNFII